MSNALTGRYAIQHAGSGSKPFHRIMLLECIAVVGLFALFATSLANAQSYLTAPVVPQTVQICSNPVIPGTPGYGQNLGVLTSPYPTLAAVVAAFPNATVTDVAAGDNSSLYLTFRTPGTSTTPQIFFFETGVHTLGTGPYASIQPGNYSMFIGAPNAVISGIYTDGTIDDSAFAGTLGSYVTIEYFTIQNFGSAPVVDNTQTPPFWSGGNRDEVVVNHDGAANWTIQYNTVVNNHGGAVNGSSGGVVSFNCLKSNGQYGMNLVNSNASAAVFGYNNKNPFTPPLVLAINGVTIANNEIANNNTDNWEVKSTQYRGAPVGCGCTGGAKFWDSSALTVQNNYVHDNNGKGLWADTDNADMMFNGNYFANNSSEGLMVEISYNTTITNNIFVGNGIPEGQTFAGNHDTFPIGSLYISQSGWDNRVDGSTGANLLTISGNTFVDNWGGVTLWEDPNRFCGQGNDGTRCTLVPTPAFTAYTTDNSTGYDCPANITESTPTPFISDCRWKTQNVLVKNNTFSLNPANLPANCTPYCGFSSLISNIGPTAPYNTTLVEDNITYNQNNNFTGNTYDGTWSFQGHAQGNAVSYQTWQGTPTSRDSNNTGGFGQDTGSTYTPPGPYITGLSATTVPIGNNVAINGFGTSFGTTPGTVSFYGMAPIIPTTGWGNAAITIPVPTLATSGYVYVTNASGSGTSNAVRLVVPVTITGASGTGVSGTSVSIAGSGFGAALNNNTVAFNGMGAAPAQIVWGTDGKSITATVPSGVTAPVNVVVTVNGISSNFFAVGSGTPTPNIAIGTPTSASGGGGSAVTINATNLGTSTAGTINFGGTLQNVTWTNASGSATISTTVPTGLSGSLQVYITPTNGTESGVKSNNVSFNDTDSGIPNIAIATPVSASGAGGSPVTITATSLGTSTAGTISFGGTNQNVTWTNTSGSATISTTVPTGLSGALQVYVTPTNGTQSGARSNSVPFSDTDSSGTGTNYLDSNTANLDGSGTNAMGAWVFWYNDTIAQSPTGTGAGSPPSAHAMSISVAANTYGWGVQLGNYPGFSVTSITNPITVSFSAMAVSGGIGTTAVFKAEWTNSAGTILRSDAVTTILTAAWQSQSMGFPAPPAGTATLQLTLTGNGGGGTSGIVIYADSFFVGSNAPTPNIAIATPASSSGGGGSAVTINATNLGTSTAGTINFGGTLQNVTWINTSGSATISTTVPTGLSGPLQVYVTPTNGTEAGVKSNNVSFNDTDTITPNIAVATPTSASGGGGSAVTINATNLGTSTAGTINFGGTLQNVTWTNASGSATISTTVPTGLSGSLQVYVTPTNGTQSGVKSNSVSFTDTDSAPLTNYLDINTANLDGSGSNAMGAWVFWYNDTIAQSPTGTGAGSPPSAHAMSISVAANTYGWGVQLGNYPGFSVTSITNPITVSFSAMAVSGGIGTTAVLKAEWTNSAGTILRSDAVTTILTAAWQSQSMGFPAPPAGTATLLLTLTGNGGGGTSGIVIYADSFFVGH